MKPVEQTLLTLALALAAAQPVKAASTAEDEAQALIGLEFNLAAPGARYADHLSCTDRGGGAISIDGALSDRWSSAEALCQGRVVLMLVRAEGDEQPVKGTRKIVDAVALPPVQTGQPYRNKPGALWLFTPEECVLDGKGGTSFFALVRWTAKSRIDFRHGLVKAWGYDTQHGRIVPIAPRRVSCRHPEAD
jgi:hypothetical protein